MPIGDYTPVPKPSYRRNKPTRRQRGEISAKVRKQLHERSKGICERCYSTKAVEAAHTLRRWRIQGKTTLEDLVHLCVPCHRHCDHTMEGRVFLEQFRKLKYKAAGRLNEYYE